MRVVPLVQFGTLERDLLVRTLQGHEYVIETTGRKGEKLHPVRALLGRVRQEEPLEARALDELIAWLAVLVGRWEQEATPEAWRAMGAPGSDEAVDGLAAERTWQVANGIASFMLVRKARELTGPPALTKTEKKAVGL